MVTVHVRPQSVTHGDNRCSGSYWACASCRVMQASPRVALLCLNPCAQNVRDHTSRNIFIFIVRVPAPALEGRLWIKWGVPFPITQTYFLYRIMQPQTLLDGVWHRELREQLQHTISTACALHFPECLVTLLVGGNMLFIEEDLLQVNNWWLFELKNNQQAMTFCHLLMRGALLRLADLQESDGVFWCPSHKDSESTAARQ